MTSSFRFPLYVFQGIGNSGVVFKKLGGEKHLLLFTSAENASVYRDRESLHVQMLRLKTSTELRELLAAQVDVDGIKIVVDPVEKSVPIA